MNNRKVNTFFIGFPKSGSTLFWNMLREHPEVYSPSIKELNFFNIDHQELLKRNLGKNYFSVFSSESEYEEAFSQSNLQINADFTPLYIYSEEAPKKIFKYNPDARIIISIREPISYIRSVHFQNLYNLSEDEEDFLKALSLEDERKAGRNIPKNCTIPLFLFYSELVQYQKFINNYASVFPNENIKIIVFDYIVADKFTVYRELLRFIGVNDLNFFPSEPDRNPSHTLRFRALRKLLFYPPIKKFIYNFIPKKLMPFSVKISQSVFKREAKRPIISESELSEIKKRFQPGIEQLNEYLHDNGFITEDLNELWQYHK